MYCDRLNLLQHMAVNNPERLEEKPWKEHLSECDQCRVEWESLAGSLAVFRQLESERESQFEFTPSWENFSDILVRDKRRNRFFLMPVAAATVGGLLLMGGIAAWLFWPSPGMETVESAKIEDAAPLLGQQHTRPLEKEEMQAFIEQLRENKSLAAFQGGNVQSYQLEIRLDRDHTGKLKVVPRLVGPVPGSGDDSPTIFMRSQFFKSEQNFTPRTMPINNMPINNMPINTMPINNNLQWSK